MQKPVIFLNQYIVNYLALKPENIKFIRVK